MSGTRWLHSTAHRRPDPPVARLVCFPHAGGSPRFFDGWQELLPGVEVHAARYPGRADRFGESPETSLLRLARRLATAILPLTGDGVPLLLFGHSLGAPVALETARAMEVCGARIARLFASGSRHGEPPGGDPARFVPDQDEDEVVAGLLELGGTEASLLADPAAREVVVPTVMADTRMYHAYDMEQTPRLCCPVTTIVGDVDDQADVRPWHAVTTGGVTEEVVEGGHFYLIDRPPLHLVRAAAGAEGAGRTTSRDRAEATR